MCNCHDHDPKKANQPAHGMTRRAALRGGFAATTAAAAATFASAQGAAAMDKSPYAEPAEPALPPSDMKLDLSRAALVVIDPQIDFLHPKGVTWGVIGPSVEEHNTVQNIETLFKSAKQHDITTAVSPHYYYPTDHSWKFEGALEKLMHKIGMFNRAGPLDLDGFEGSGADWMPQYKQYIEDGKTIVTSPHKVYGNDTNDLSLQLRKRGVDQVILAGMSANLCVESHMRELLEDGFEVAVVKDATAAAKVPEGDGYLAALINFRYMANAVWSTEEAVAQINAAA
ncbi:cysteine hydrolase [Thalassovita mediterranea]|jgi:nicotinamidase-related amidase|uniref:Isochorismatase family protein YecD n=1 Tax=Thalassovita mediterranea TaxID=340021 RepID=A0A0P1GL94_9RHOB|nr:cysteine hydrolase [Thalassovita mediterranea]MCG7573590.1 cysteine hydrolase [Phaeobacter sp. CNT1-3]CUH82865.1 Isochorismatase family protein YecD [Thalassovita mediterranea]SIS31490.1 Nicotinamidase-related amidase [Thalassovita mediterranea]